MSLSLAVPKPPFRTAIAAALAIAAITFTAITTPNSASAAVVGNPGNFILEMTGGDFSYFRSDRPLGTPNNTKPNWSGFNLGSIRETSNPQRGPLIPVSIADDGHFTISQSTFNNHFSRVAIATDSGSGSADFASSGTWSGQINPETGAVSIGGPGSFKNIEFSGINLESRCDINNIAFNTANSPAVTAPVSTNEYPIVPPLTSSQVLPSRGSDFVTAQRRLPVPAVPVVPEAQRDPNSPCDQLGGAINGLLHLPHGPAPATDNYISFKWHLRNSSDTQDATIDPGVTAAFTNALDPADSSKTVLDASTSRGAPGKTLKYQWEVVGESPATAPSTSPRYVTALSPGTHTVKLTVTDSDSGAQQGRASITKQISVGSPADLALKIVPDARFLSGGKAINNRLTRYKLQVKNVGDTTAIGGTGAGAVYVGGYLPSNFDYKEIRGISPGVNCHYTPGAGPNGENFAYCIFTAGQKLSPGDTATIGLTGYPNVAANSKLRLSFDLVWPDDFEPNGANNNDVNELDVIQPVSGTDVAITDTAVVEQVDQSSASDLFDPDRRDRFNVGGYGFYWISVANLNRTPQEGTLDVKLTLPAGVSLRKRSQLNPSPVWDAFLSSGICAEDSTPGSRSVTCSYTLTGADALGGTTYPGGVTVPIPVSIDAGVETYVTNAATATLRGQTDVHADNNVVSFATPARPDIALAASSLGDAQVGDTVEFELTPTTKTPQTAKSVQFGLGSRTPLKIEGNLPQGFSFVSGNSALTSAQDWTCSTPQIPNPIAGPRDFTCNTVDPIPGNSTGDKIKVVARVDSRAYAGKTTPVTTDVSFKSSTPFDANLTNNTATIGSLPVKASDLSTAVTAPSEIESEKQAAVNVKVSNGGQIPSSGVTTVVASKPAGAKLTATAPAGWTCDDSTDASVSCTSSNAIAAGGSVSLPLAYSLQTDEQVDQTVSARVANARDGDAANDSGSAKITVKPKQKATCTTNCGGGGNGGAPVGNPGPLSASVLGGSISIGTAVVDKPIEVPAGSPSPLVLNGSIDKDGNTSFPLSNAKSNEFKIVSRSTGLAIPVTIKPASDASGTVLPASGTASLKLKFQIRINYVPILTCDYPVANPIEMDATATDYDQATGIATFDTGKINLPGLDDCGAGAAALNGAIGVPGAGNLKLRVQYSPAPRAGGYEPPVGGSSTATASLTSKRITFKGKSKTPLLPIACRGDKGKFCEGTLAVTGNVGKTNKRKKTKAVKVKSTIKYKIAAGQTSKLKLKLSRKQLEAFKKFKSAKLKTQIKAAGAAKAATAVTVSVIYKRR